MNDINEFCFIGTIVNKKVTDTVGYLTIGVFRELLHRKRIADYPRIICYGEDVKKQLESMENHEKVLVKGYISSKSPRKEREERRAREANNERSYRSPQVFVAESIEPAPTMLDERLGIESEGMFVPDKNEIKLVGTVNRVYMGKGGNINLIIASTREDGKYLKFIHVTRFPLKSENIMEYARPGIKVGIVASVRTTRKEAPDGKLVNYESIVAEAIAPATEKSASN